MKLEKYENIYFIGIGGIGMSALARYFKGRNKRVAGYDKTPTDITRALEQEGIIIHFVDGVNQIDRDFKDIENTLVVYTPAIPRDHEELTYFRQNDFDVYKRARILAEIANQGKSIAVAGTHGKTTTSSLITHIFNQNKAVASAFLGGIAKNAGSNFISGSGKTVILEADEFDRSFHQLEPDVALITAMDADHLDIYGTAQALEQAFADFAKRVKPSGTLILCHGLPLHGITYGLNEEADYHAKDIHIKNGTYHFTLVTPSGEEREITSGLPGRHNVENGVGAAAACLEYGLTLDKVAKGIASFTGVTRRFDVHVNTEKYIYIDDYAHHPEEIRALLNSIREMYPGKKVTAIFQPHLFSRTKDFALTFAEVLSMPDALIMMDIYPAREKPMPGITSKWLMSKIELEDKELKTAEEIKEMVALDPPELLVTMGAGDIDRLVQPLKNILLA